MKTELRDEYYRKQRAIEKARSLLKRGIDAGIPSQYLAIDSKSFSDLICPKYHFSKEHDEVDSLTSFIYGTNGGLAKMPFILIDGGNISIRKQIGFAILFKLILEDRFGLYQECGQLAAKLQTLSFKESRTDVVDDLKNVGALFISEFDFAQFQPYVNAGGLLDELLGSRSDNLMPTIISFSKPLVEKPRLDNKQVDKNCGGYLAELSLNEYANPKNHLDNPWKGILRIRATI